MIKRSMTVSMAVALGAGFCGCKPPKQEQKRPPVSVSVATAQQANVPVYITSFGRLRALNDVNIQPQVSGKLLSAPFTEGAAVKQGDVLFEIESDTYQAAVEQAQGQLESAKATLKQNRETLKRNEKLLEQKLIAQEDYDQLQTAVDSAKAAKKEAEAALQQAQINLNYCTVTSPVSGVVGKRLVDPGNLVAPGGQTLVNVRTTDPLYVDFSVSEVYLPELKNAMAKGDVPVTLVLRENAGQPGMFRGVLKMMDNAVNTQSGTIALRALVNNPDGTLWPGQFVDVFPVLDTMDDAVLVPQSAVAIGKNGPYSFIIKDSKATVSLVTKGPNVGDALVVTKGVKKGDVVVTQGQLGLWPGADVTIQKTLDDQQQSDVKKKLSDPNVLATIHMMRQVGVPLEQIAVFVGLPASVLQQQADQLKASGGDVKDAMIRKMNKGGMSNAEIAQVTGMTEDQVAQVLSKAAAEKPAEKPEEKSEQDKQQ
jgi:multidrug efflux system membrane fusion protein